MKANDTNVIKIEAEIDLDTTPNEVRVKTVSDPWEDFGYWLEVCGFLSYQAMKYQEWTEEQILDYTRHYLQNCLKDYKIKK